MPLTRSGAVPAEPCSICLEQAADRLVLPCNHAFCRGCVDALFVRHSEAGDYASRCPQCRQPLFGQADAHFAEGMAVLNGLSGGQGQGPASIADAVEMFELCISAVQPYATGPNGLNRMAAAAKYNVGRCYEHGQSAGKAADAYRTAFGMSHDTDSKAACNLASMLLKLDQPQEAQSWLERACAINPADSLARVNLAVVAMENDDLDRARAVIQAALASNPGNARAHNTSGAIYQRCGMLEQASIAFTRALELDPLEEDASLNLDALDHYY